MTKVGLAAGFVVVALMGAFVAAAPAQAAVDVTLDSVKIAPAKADKKVKATVKATVAQQQYADISVDVTFTDFVPTKTFAFRDGECPQKLIRVSVPAEVFQCGWSLQGGNAVLSMALRGTFPSSPIQIKVSKAALVAPAKPGDYDVTVSSWAFSPLKTSVAIK